MNFTPPRGTASTQSHKTAQRRIHPPLDGSAHSAAAHVHVPGATRRCRDRYDDPSRIRHCEERDGSHRAGRVSPRAAGRVAGDGHGVRRNRHAASHAPEKHRERGQPRTLRARNRLVPPTRRGEGSRPRRGWSRVRGRASPPELEPVVERRFLVEDPTSQLQVHRPSPCDAVLLQRAAAEPQIACGLFRGEQHARFVACWCVGGVLLFPALARGIPT